MTTNQGYPSRPEETARQDVRERRLAHSVQRPQQQYRGQEPEADEAAHVRHRLRLQPQLRPSSASARYTNRRLIRTIEDIGYIGPDGEIYCIANPGYGLDRSIPRPGKPESRSPRKPNATTTPWNSASTSGSPAITSSRQPTPGAAAYGNYSGLASSDEDTPPTRPASAAAPRT